MTSHAFARSVEVLRPCAFVTSHTFARPVEVLRPLAFVTSHTFARPVEVPRSFAFVTSHTFARPVEVLRPFAFVTSHTFTRSVEVLRPFAFTALHAFTRSFEVPRPVSTGSHFPLARPVSFAHIAAESSVRRALRPSASEFASRPFVAAFELAFARRHAFAIPFWRELRFAFGLGFRDLRTFRRGLVRRGRTVLTESERRRRSGERTYNDESLFHFVSP